MPDRATAHPERAYERAHERVYERLYDRIDRLEDRLEDAISHFHNLMNELRERVSTLEKKHR